MLSKISERFRKLNIYMVVEDSYLMFFGFYLLFLVNGISKFDIRFSWDVDLWLLRAFKVLTVLKIVMLLWMNRLKLKSDSNFRCKTLAILVAAVFLGGTYYMVFRSDHYIFLKYLSLLVVGMIGTDYRKVLKLYVCLVGLFLGAIILAAWSGIITNLVYFRGDGTYRSAWGTIFPTDFASSILFVCISGWIGYKKVPSWVFVFLGAISLFVSLVVTRSFTSSICNALFITLVFVECIISKKCHKSNCKKLKDNEFFQGTISRLSSLLVSIAFPFFAMLMYGLVFLYSKGKSISYKFDNLLHSRLSLGYKGYLDHGLSLFGVPFDQHGAGGSTFGNSEYNFIDSTYMLILLRYGVVLFLMLTILWVLMTRKGIKLGDWRLAFGMGVIAFHSFMEHHFIEVNYNVLLVLPFSILGMGWLSGNNNIKENRQDDTSEELFKDSFYLNEAHKIFACLISGAVVLFLALISGPQFLMWLRTLWDVTVNIEFRGKMKIVVALLISLIVAVIISGASLYRILISIYEIYWNHKNNTGEENRKILGKKNGKIIFLSTVIILLSSFGLIVSIVLGDRIITAKNDYHLNSSEDKAIEAVIKADSEYGGRFFSEDVPYLYNKRYGGVSSLVYSGDELAIYDNTTILMDVNYESACLIGIGFLYTEISDTHALYTNNPAVITALKESGYHLTGYFSRKLSVDLKVEADRNNLQMTDKEQIIVDGKGGSIISGPYYDLRMGKYTITFRLSLNDASVDTEHNSEDDYQLCTLRVSTLWGNNIVKDVQVFRSQFNDGGVCEIEVVCNIPESRGGEFLIFAEDGCSFNVDEITCQKTPDSDTHITYDKRGRKIREEYYDIEGNPLEMPDGYYACEFEYKDSKDKNISLFRYLDSEASPVITTRGYAELGREYDVRNRVIREIYYDTEGNRITLKSGESAVSYDYDDAGNIIVYRYCDKNDSPVMLEKGYSILRKDFNDDRKVIHEAYYDINDKPILSEGGYASVDHDYDENGNEILLILYDENGNRVIGGEGYAERRRTFDDFKRVIREEYFDINGSRMLFESEYAIVEYVYDIYGNQSEFRFYGVDEKPIMRLGNYSIVKKIYNERGQSIREDYFDTDNHPVIISYGYASIERNYDENSHVIREAYYGVDGKLMVMQAGHSIVEYGYDDDGNRTESRYYGPDEKPVMVWNAYARVHNDFNDKHQAIAETYYDEDNKIVERNEGYTTFVREYDEIGNAYILRFCDEFKKPVMRTDGYAEVHRTFNEKNQIICEDYYDAQGKKVALPAGNASVTYEYDNQGNQIKLTYYDLNGKKVHWWGHLVSIRRVYNDHHQVIREEYLDENDKLMNRAEGYAIVEQEYDSVGNIIVQRYYDSDNKLVLNTSGYAELNREYDEGKRVTKQMYYGTDGEPINNADGVAVVENEYDSSGKLMNTVQYDIDGNMVE